MSDVQTIVNNLRQLSLKNLSNDELDVLKDEIIKLLVDIQIQKEINAKAHSGDLTMDEGQLELLQEMNSKLYREPNQINNDISIEKKEQSLLNAQIEFHNLIKEEIPDRIVSIYSEGDNNNKDIENVVERNNEKQCEISTNVQKIIFNINDKYRIIRKLFSNNVNQFNEFINLLNDFQNIRDSEQFIKGTSAKYLWDEDSFEYKILLQQNRKRFK